MKLFSGYLGFKSVRKASSSTRGSTKALEGTNITFKKLICVSDVGDGSSTLVDTGKTFTGILANKHFAEGSMKLAFHVSPFIPNSAQILSSSPFSWSQRITLMVNLLPSAFSI